MAHRKKLLATVAAASLLAPGFAQAQDQIAPQADESSGAAAPDVADQSSANDVGEILVTAQKRSESIQKVPLSIVAVSNEVLTSRGIVEVKGLEKMVPNLRLNSISQASGVALRIRGIGTSSNAAIDPSVAPYIDGVFIPRPGAVLTRFLDVSGIEVLRGPQGTLFGRNATVGAISIKSAEPSLSEFSGRISGELANYGGATIDGMVNAPVTDNLALRFAGTYSHTDGYYVNRLDGNRYGRNNSILGRVSAKWEISPSVTWLLRVDAAHTTGDGVELSQPDDTRMTPTQIANWTARFGATPTFGPSFDINQRVNNVSLDDKQIGVSSDLSWDFGDGYTIRLINAYRYWKNLQSDGDVIFTARDLLTRDALFRSKSQSHELQFISPTDLLDGKLNFVGGLYLFKEDYRIGEVFNLGSEWCSFVVAAASPGNLAGCLAGPKDEASDSLFDQKATSKAVYGQLTYNFTPSLELTLGGRYTWDDKVGSFVQHVSNPGATVLRTAENTSLKFSDSKPSFRANLSWEPAPRVMAFLTYSTGYKSGGLNSAGGTTNLGQRRLFDSENAKDIELGIKSTLLDGRALLNLTAYRTTLSGFQERSFDGTSFIIRNAGSIRAQGVELESRLRLAEGLTLQFSAAYLDSIYTDNQNAPGLPACTGAATSCPTRQDLSGRRSVLAPKWQGNVGLEYVAPPIEGFTLSLGGDLNFTSSQYSTPDLNPNAILDPYQIGSFRLSIESPKRDWTFSVLVDNVTDERYYRLYTAQTLDALFGQRIPATGQSILRGFMGPPRTVRFRLAKTF